VKGRNPRPKKEPNWEKLAELFGNCTETMEKHGVDPELWGLCEQCPVIEECPNYKDEQNHESQSHTAQGRDREG